MGTVRPSSSRQLVVALSDNYNSRWLQASTNFIQLKDTILILLLLLLLYLLARGVKRVPTWHDRV